MPEFNEDEKRQIIMLIQGFYDRKILPMHEEIREDLDAVKKAIDDGNLITTTTANVLEKMDKTKNRKQDILIALLGIILALLIALGLVPKIKGVAGIFSMDNHLWQAQNGSQHAAEPDSNIGSN